MINFTKILALLLLFAVNLHAQEKSSRLDSVTTGEIIVNANRVKTSVLLAPNKIQILDEKLISSANGSRLSDVLAFSDAVFIKDYGFNSGLKTISLNSTQSEQTLILLDGVKLNGQDNSQLDISLMQLDDISRIEISSGGLSALYGSEAIGGVINILTKKNSLNKPFGFELNGTYGSYGLKKVYAKVFQQITGKGKKFIDYDIAYSNESAKNNYDYNYFNGISTIPKTRDNNDYFNHLLNFNFNIKLNNKSDLKIFTNYNYWNRNVPGLELGYSPGTAKQIDRDAVSSVIFNRILSKRLSIKSNFDYKYTLRSYYDTSTFNLSTKINSFYKLNSYIHGSAFTYIPSKTGELDFGYETSYNNINSDQTSEGNLLHGGLYTSGKYEIKSAVASKVTFYPSIRYDYFSNIADKNVITGKIGINIKPFEKTDFSLKSSFGNNFRAPSFDDLYWKDLGNPSLRPEKSIAFDAGFFYGFNFFSGNEIELSYFNINTTDRIVWTPDQSNIWRPINIGKAKSEGIDLSFKNSIEFSKKINTVLHFNYNYANSLKKNEDFPGDPSYNKQMLYIPQEYFKASVMFNYLTSSEIIKFVSLNAFYSYSGRRYMNSENTIFVPNYGLADANLSFGLNIFKAEADLKLAVDNIFNEDYQVIAGYPMPLRNYRLQVSFKY